MTTKRYLSNKKITQQTISISPALRDWIRRYVNVMHKKNPEDDNYKSISAFYCSVMENVLKIFEKGKSLDDFDRVVDGEMRDFFDNITFKAVIPFHEGIFMTHRYTKTDLNSMLSFFITLRKIYIGKNKVLDYKTLKKVFERVRIYFSTNKLLKETSLDFLTKRNEKYPIIILEVRFTHRNIHYENCKAAAILIGMLGAKIVNILYSPDEFYTRFEIEITDLAFETALVLNERKKLINQNLEYFTNYYRVLNDNDFFLWMKLANDNDIIINFKTDDVREKWIGKIENDLQKFGSKDEFLLYLLNYFDHLHWIRIESEKELSFKVNLSTQKNKDEIEFMLKQLSKYSIISEKNGIYFIEKK